MERHRSLILLGFLCVGALNAVNAAAIIGEYASSTGRLRAAPEEGADQAVPELYTPEQQAEMAREMERECRNWAVDHCFQEGMEGDYQCILRATQMCKDYKEEDEEKMDGEMTDEQMRSMEAECQMMAGESCMGSEMMDQCVEEAYRQCMSGYQGNRREMEGGNQGNQEVEEMCDEYAREECRGELTDRSCYSIAMRRCLDMHMEGGNHGNNNGNHGNSEVEMMCREKVEEECEGDEMCVEPAYMKCLEEARPMNGSHGNGGNHGNGGMGSVEEICHGWAQSECGSTNTTCLTMMYAGCLDWHRENGNPRTVEETCTLWSREECGGSDNTSCVTMMYMGCVDWHREQAANGGNMGGNVEEMCHAWSEEECGGTSNSSCLAMMFMGCLDWHRNSGAGSSVEEVCHAWARDECMGTSNTTCLTMMHKGCMDWHRTNGAGRRVEEVCHEWAMNECGGENGDRSCFSTMYVGCLDWHKQNHTGEGMGVEEICTVWAQEECRENPDRSCFSQMYRGCLDWHMSNGGGVEELCRSRAEQNCRQGDRMCVDREFQRCIDEHHPTMRPPNQMQVVMKQMEDKAWENACQMHAAVQCLEREMSQECMTEVFYGCLEVLMNLDQQGVRDGGMGGDMDRDEMDKDSMEKDEKDEKEGHWVYVVMEGDRSFYYIMGGSGDGEEQMEMVESDDRSWVSMVTPNTWTYIYEEDGEMMFKTKEEMEAEKEMDSSEEMSGDGSHSNEVEEICHEWARNECGGTTNTSCLTMMYMGCLDWHKENGNSANVEETCQTWAENECGGSGNASCVGLMFAGCVDWHRQQAGGGNMAGNVEVICRAWARDECDESSDSSCLTMQYQGCLDWHRQNGNPGTVEEICTLWSRDECAGSEDPSCLATMYAGCVEWHQKQASGGNMDGDSMEGGDMDGGDMDGGNMDGGETDTNIIDGGRTDRNDNDDTMGGNQGGMGGNQGGMGGNSGNMGGNAGGNSGGSAGGEVEAFTWSCNFEGEDMCDLVQDNKDDFDWSMAKGGTPSEETGPNAAAEGEYFIFIEASDPRKEGDKARMVLPRGSANSYCLSFEYNMNGHHMGDLAVVAVSPSGGETDQWRVRGHKGSTWMRASVNVNVNSDDQILLCATRGREFSGDIAVDQINLVSGSC